jgi:antirestriction protein ArdC
MNGNVQGYARERTISVSPVAALPHKTTIHELAHVVLGHTSEGTMSDSDTTPRDVREIEAEGTAYLVCSALGLSGAAESRGYLQHWAHGEEISERSAQRIFSAAGAILRAGQEGGQQ